MSAPKAKLSEGEIRALAQAKSTEIQNLVTKVGELEREAEEHALVIETVKDANSRDPDRKCFRLIGGVLVERTVKDVLPDLLSNHEQIKGVMDRLVEEYKKKDNDFAVWQRENNVKIQQRP